MKKRKPPVILASSLIVLLGGAIIIMMPKAPSPNDMPGAQAQKAPDASPGAARPTEDASSIKKQLAVVGDATREGMQPPDDPTGAGALANPKVATIYIPRPQTTKPVPNDASVQGQWYREGARASDPDGFKNP